MATITNKVTRQIPAPMQWWNSASDTNDSGGAIAIGDIFKIAVSLNGPAKEAVITTTSANTMSFRTNSIQTVFPHRPQGEFLYSEGDLFIASGVDFTDLSQKPVVVPGNTTMTLTGPINDLQIVTLSGAFTLRVKR